VFYKWQKGVYFAAIIIFDTLERFLIIDFRYRLMNSWLLPDTLVCI